jgi:homoserine acetyltransferase
MRVQWVIDSARRKFGLEMVEMNFQRRDLLLWAALAATTVKPALAQDPSPREGPVGSNGRSDHDVFELGDVALQSGITLPRAKLAYKTYGKLATARDNAILMPTYYGGRHTNNEAMIGAGRALDPARWFIIVPNMFGNGLSSSPSNIPLPFDRAGFPNVTLYDNVVCQHRLVTQKLEISPQVGRRLFDGSAAGLSLGCTVSRDGPGDCTVLRFRTHIAP